jgi:ssDNA-binding replication factor A large subunit
VEKSMVERAEEIYQALLEAGISEQEINQAIVEKDTEFQGFMTKPAILYLIAKEHGIDVESNENKEILNHIAEEIIDYNDFAIPITSVVENLRNIVIAGRIEAIFQIRDFIKKDGTPGRVGSFQICDKSGCIKIVLWNNDVETMENDLFKKGEIVQIIGGYSKMGRDDKLEVHLSRQGKIVLAPENVKIPEDVQSEPRSIRASKPSSPPKLNKGEKKSGWTIQSLQNRDGFIRFISGVVKVDSFKELTLKNGGKSFLLKLELSDITGSIMVTIWGLQAVEAVKLITDGDTIKLSNVVIKDNSYTNEKELNFTKKSSLEIIA